MNPMIPSQIYPQRKSDYVGVDNLKIGVYFKIKLLNPISSDQLKEMLTSIEHEIIKDAISKERLSLQDERGGGEKGLKSHKIRPGIKIRHNKTAPDEVNLACYLNHLNGNLLLRRFLTTMYFAEDDRKIIFKLRSTTLNRHDRNFIPLYLRTHRSCKRDIGHHFKETQNKLLFDAIESFKDSIIQFLTPHVSEINFETCCITCAEICFDDTVPAGINYVTHPELGMRLARSIALGKRGKYFGVGDKKQQAILPPSIAEGFILKSVFGDTMIPGVDSLYGHFKDKTELYVAAKEIPNVPVDADDQRRFTRNFQQIRYEWRLRHNPRFKRDELATLLKTYTEQHKTFQDFASFNTAINLLKDKFRGFLSDTLNVESPLTAPPKLNWAYFLAARYQLQAEGLVALFTYPYRLNSHAYCADEDRLEQGRQMGIFEKRPGYYDQDYGIRWDYFDDPKKFRTKSVFYPGRRNKRQSEPSDSDLDPFQFH